MLSEDRNIQRNRLLSDFAMNPRGQLWKKGEHSLGNKLMKKMGWKTGEGLGKNATGITRPVRLEQSYDKEGLGYSKHLSDYSWNWLSNQNDFDFLLNQLQEQHPVDSDNGFNNPTSSNSHPVDLEKKSKGSRKRVHYQRAIQGKNLSNRSKADWRCILGVKKKKRKHHTLNPETESEQEVVEEKKEMFTTSNVLSNDYFMMKKRLKLEEGNSAEHGLLAGKCEESSEEGTVDSGISINDGMTVEDSEEITTPSCFEKKRKAKKRGKKKRQKRKSDGPEPLEDDHVVPTQEEKLEKENRCRAEDSLIVYSKSKRKNRKKKRCSRLAAISDMTNLEQTNEHSVKDSEVPLNSHTSVSVEKTEPKCILKKHGQKDETVTAERQKKQVHFLDKPIVGYVPRKDSVRGGAWVWKVKIKFHSA